MNRRGFLTGLVSVIAAPAIVRAASIMPVRALVTDRFGHVPALLDAQCLINFRRSVTLEYIRHNLFTPYSALDLALAADERRAA
jgi:hypothetical protein